MSERLGQEIFFAYKHGIQAGDGQAVTETSLPVGDLLDAPVVSRTLKRVVLLSGRRTQVDASWVMAKCAGCVQEGVYVQLTDIDNRPGKKEFPVTVFDASGTIRPLFPNGEITEELVTSHVRILSVF